MKTFALFLAPWDLADRGARPLLAWAAEQGINTICLASQYHAGWFLHPHHGGHKAFMAEDGVCFFHPQLSLYAQTPLKPQGGLLARERDWVDEARRQCSDLGLRLFLWTVCLHNTRLGLLHPEATCRNAFGDAYPHALCPTHPEVRAYVKALVRDQLRYQPDGFFLEATGYMGRRHGHHHERDGLPLPDLEQRLLDLSFAPSDLEAAAQRGVDGGQLAQQVAAHLGAYLASAPARPAGMPATLDQFRQFCPDLARYEEAQRHACDSLVEEIRASCPAGVQLLGSGHPAMDLVYHGAYNESAEQIERGLPESARRLRQGQRLILGLRLGFNPPPETPAINSREQACEIARLGASAGVQGLSFYFYGEAPAGSLQWIKPAIEAAQRRIERSAPARPGRSQPSSGQLGVGLIGCGSAGGAHLLALRDVPGVTLMVAMDAKPEKARRMADQLEIRHVADKLDGVLGREDVDLVVVATPPNAHARIARLVMAADKHLLLEKPFGMDLHDAEQILSYCRGSAGVAAGALVHRYNGARWAARQFIQAGAIGSVRLVRHRFGIYMYDDPRFVRPAAEERGWLTDAATASGGILPSASIHSLSALSYLLGHPRFLTVRGAIRRLHPRAFDGIEDDVSLMLNLSGGIEVIFEESWACRMPYQTMIFGDRGWLRLDGESFNDVSLTGQCAGAAPPELRPFIAGGRVSVRPHELDDVVPCGFAGLARDVAAACRGEVRPDLPDMYHARNMRAVIEAAVGACGTDASRAVSWKSPATPPAAIVHGS